MEASIVAKFWSRVEPMMDDRGCWEWRGKLNSGGYAVLWRGRRGIMAHRLSLIIHTGLNPSDLDTDHLCRNRGCVNPHHLEFVTRRVNLLRGVGLTATKARQTHCARGHKFTATTTYIRSCDGTRHCRPCAALLQRERRKR